MAVESLQFQSDRLLFSPLAATDIEGLFRYASDPEVAKYTSWEAHKSVEDSTAYIQHVLRRHRQDPASFHVVWAIRKIESLEVIGTISLRTESLRIGHLDYALSRAFWGQGLVTEAVRKLIQEMKRLLPELEEIHSGCLDLNTGSVRVLEKCGFNRTASYESERGGKFGGALLTTHEYLLKVSRNG